MPAGILSGDPTRWGRAKAIPCLLILGFPEQLLQLRQRFAVLVAAGKALRLDDVGKRGQPNPDGAQGRIGCTRQKLIEPLASAISCSQVMKYIEVPGIGSPRRDLHLLESRCIDDDRKCSSLLIAHTADPQKRAELQKR